MSKSNDSTIEKLIRKSFNATDVLSTPNNSPYLFEETTVDTLDTLFYNNGDTNGNTRRLLLQAPLRRNRKHRWIRRNTDSKSRTGRLIFGY